MGILKQSCELTTYRTLTELAVAEQELLLAARQATQCAYAPYSQFYVGAAVRLSNGAIVVGTNQENAAYPMGLCAERVALFSAFTQYPAESLTAIAVAAASENNSLRTQLAKPITPCGACRQAIMEYLGRSQVVVPLLMAGTEEIWRIADVRQILPFLFTLTDKVVGA